MTRTTRRLLVLLLPWLWGGFVSAAELAQQPPQRRPNPAMAPVTDVAGLPRVLLIGDSISIGYTLATRELLAGEGNVHRIPGDEVRYNAVAREVMREEGVAIDDLYAFAMPRLAEIGKPADVHYTPEGSRKLATQVAGSIEAALKNLPQPTTERR